jgi:hypothetical protein
MFSACFRWTAPSAKYIMGNSLLGQGRAGVDLKSPFADSLGEVSVIPVINVAHTWFAL